MRASGWFFACLLSSLIAMPAAATNYFVAIGDDCTADQVVPGSSFHDCFDPTPLTIKVGDKVDFYIYCEIVCRGPHNVVADDGSFRCAHGCDNDGMGGNGDPDGYWSQWHFTLTFVKPGIVKYYDEVTGEPGVIVVLAGLYADVVEFFNPDLGTYFITADPVEQAFVDGGGAGRWQRTGGSFHSGGPAPVCRFVGNPNIDVRVFLPWGPNSHFYTADPYECSLLKGLFDPNAASWKFESNDFMTSVVGPAGCPEEQVPVYRAYNNGYARGVDANHRITANRDAYRSMIAKGWIGEGIVMCAPK
jgi:plastocyanin